MDKATVYFSVLDDHFIKVAHYQKRVLNGCQFLKKTQFISRDKKNIDPGMFYFCLFFSVPSSTFSKRAKCFLILLPQFFQFFSGGLH